MKFKCLNPECGKLFMYAAKKILPVDEEGDKALAISIGSTTFVMSAQIERHVCPYCQSLDIEECAEPQAEIVGVLSVDLDQVNQTLKDNPEYVVESLYSKTATLVKREKKEV